MKVRQPERNERWERGEKEGRRTRLCRVWQWPAIRARALQPKLDALHLLSIAAAVQELLATRKARGKAKLVQGVGWQETSCRETGRLTEGQAGQEGESGDCRGATHNWRLPLNATMDGAPHLPQVQPAEGEDVRAGCRVGELGDKGRGAQKTKKSQHSSYHRPLLPTDGSGGLLDVRTQPGVELAPPLGLHGSGRELGAVRPRVAGPQVCEAHPGPEWHQVVVLGSSNARRGDPSLDEYRPHPVPRVPALSER